MPTSVVETSVSYVMHAFCLTPGSSSQLCVYWEAANDYSSICGLATYLHGRPRLTPRPWPRLALVITLHLFEERKHKWELSFTLTLSLSL